MNPGTKNKNHSSCFFKGPVIISNKETGVITQVGTFLGLTKVQALLRDKADPNLRDSCSETPLLQAAAQGDLDVSGLSYLVGWLNSRS